MITLSTGAGVMLLAGQAVVSYSSGAVVDVTAGQTAASGTALSTNHRYLAAENTAAAVSITSDTAVICLEGSFSLSASGETDYNALADALKAMGMFQGGDTGYGSGYDLERAPTRIEGLIMFLRLLGEEQAALSYTGACPFGDIPAWAQRYAAYAYDRGYTRGVGTGGTGELVFGTQNTITAGEYVTFVLRALGYSDSGSTPDFIWDTALDKGAEAGVLTAGGVCAADGETLPPGAGGVSLLFRPIGPGEGRQRHSAGQACRCWQRGPYCGERRHGWSYRDPAELKYLYDKSPARGEVLRAPGILRVTAARPAPFFRPRIR